ncbi:sodium:proton antiporter NhaD [Agitococcus lubricus]|uniref:Sodium/proton antiporter (NhaD family) n=1 Tax=Agitococcus lubricus TaxID=1077255 RepID=A0A2T5J468_9GAMM|nr:sodium:proton antiporter NhaD [Agitococcus lubricus]PTQ91417.1 sodium/proton antiporter (NhaD family) [Agitococcus lubricus]
MLKFLSASLLLALPTFSYASTHSDFTQQPLGYTVLALFILSYLCVIFEEKTHIKKSLPVTLAAGLIWVVIAYNWTGEPQLVEEAVKHYLLEYGELLLFLLVAMTYVNALTERGIFDALRVWLIGRGFNYRALFWLTGGCAFFLSPVLDNLTTALILCAVLMAVGKDNPKFISLGAINIVVAANAGGAFSPFGDITTLMVWQKGLVEFWTFFNLFLPSLVNFVVPALCMSFAISTDTPPASHEPSPLKRGAWTVLMLFIATIVLAVSFHSFLHLPPFLGMMTGLALLKFYGYYLQQTHVKKSSDESHYGSLGDIQAFDSFKFVAQAEWDTLLFFFGVIMCVGGLGFVGYLELASHLLYHDLGATTANVSIGLLSAVVDNIPVMVAVLQMNPEMSTGQWLLVTLTAGVGGSLLSVGSAAGVAMMGQAKGYYTFFSHLKWTWAVALGYVLSIVCHFMVNRALF